MQKLSKLSKEQNQLINDNYNAVLQNLKRHFSQRKYSNLVIEKQSDLPYQAIGYMAEAALSWNPDKSKDKRFDKFATRKVLNAFHRSLEEGKQYSWTHNEEPQISL